MKNKFLSWALALPITPAQRTVLLAIYVEPRRVIRSKRLKSLTGLSQSTVNLSLLALERIGAIDRTFRQTSRGLMLACSYQINTGTPPNIGPLNPPKSTTQRRRSEKGSSGVIKNPPKKDAANNNIVPFPKGESA
jgi:hypothetical protein